MSVYRLLLNEVFLPECLRTYICFKAGITSDRNIKLKKHVFFEKLQKVKIRNNCLINHHVHFYMGASNE